MSRFSGSTSSRKNPCTLDFRGFGTANWLEG
jgi:hypothetical protein